MITTMTAPVSIGCLYPCPLYNVRTKNMDEEVLYISK